MTESIEEEMKRKIRVSLRDTQEGTCERRGKVRPNGGMRNV